MTPTLPACPWCGALALMLLWVEMGTEHCRCSACRRDSRVDAHGSVHQARNSDEPTSDINGVPMFEP